jgi:hypothetical protein
VWPRFNEGMSVTTSSLGDEVKFPTGHFRKIPVTLTYCNILLTVVNHCSLHYYNKFATDTRWYRCVTVTNIKLVKERLLIWPSGSRTVQDTVAFGVYTHHVFILFIYSFLHSCNFCSFINTNVNGC